jgi:hypothetical protein
MAFGTISGISKDWTQKEIKDAAGAGLFFTAKTRAETGTTVAKPATTQPAGTTVATVSGLPAAPATTNFPQMNYPQMNYPKIDNTTPTYIPNSQQLVTPLSTPNPFKPSTNTITPTTSNGTQQPQVQQPQVQQPQTDTNAYLQTLQSVLDFFKSYGNKQQNTTPYTSPYGTEIKSLLTSLQNWQQQQYNPDTDTASKLAQDQARLQTMNDMAKKGRVFDTYAAIQEQQAAQQLIPQYQQLYNQQQQQQFANMLNKLNAYQAAENQAYSQYQQGFNNNLDLSKFDWGKLVDMSNMQNTSVNQGLQKQQVQNQTNSTNSNIQNTNFMQGIQSGQLDNQTKTTNTTTAISQAQEARNQIEFNQKQQIQQFGTTLSTQASDIRKVYDSIPADRKQSYQKYSNDYAAILKTMDKGQAAYQELNAIRLFDKILPNIDKNPEYKNYLINEYGFTQKQVQDLLTNKKIAEGNMSLSELKVEAEKLSVKALELTNEYTKAIKETKIDAEKAQLKKIQNEVDESVKKLDILKQFGEKQAQANLDKVAADIKEANDRVSLAWATLEETKNNNAEQRKLEQQRIDVSKEKPNMAYKDYLKQIIDMKNDTVSTEWTNPLTTMKSIEKFPRYTDNDLYNMILGYPLTKEEKLQLLNDAAIKKEGNK